MFPSSKTHYITQQYIHVINTIFFTLIHPYLPQQITELQAQIHAAIKKRKKFLPDYKDLSCCHYVYFLHLFLSFLCITLCSAEPSGEEKRVFKKKKRVFWLKDTKLIFFTEAGSILFDNSTPLNEQSTHGQIYHVDHQILIFCSSDYGVTSAVREYEFDKTHVTTSCCFFTNLHKVRVVV